MLHARFFLKIFFPDVTFPVFSYLMGKTKNQALMIYIIHNRIVWIYNEHDIGEPFRRMFFPSWRNEHRKTTTVIRLLTQVIDSMRNSEPPRRSRPPTDHAAARTHRTRRRGTRGGRNATTLGWGRGRGTTRGFGCGRGPAAR